MTVNSTVITSGPYTGNDLTFIFPYTFRIENKTQIKVFETDDQGVQTTLNVDADYVVGDIGVDDGGNITRVAGPLPTGYEWYIRSDYKQTQLVAFESQGGFFPDVHETAIDKLTYLHLQNKDRLDRTVTLSEGYSGELPLQPLVPSAGRFLRWRSDLLGFENVDMSDLPADTVLQDLVISFDSVSDMKLAELQVGQIALTNNYYSDDTGGGSKYVVIDSQSADGYADHVLANNNVAVLQIDNELNVKQFGAHGDDLTDDTLSFQAAHDALPETGGSIYIPSGTYILDKTVQSEQFTVSKSNVTIRGDGWASVLKHTTSGTVEGNQAVVFLRPLTADLNNVILKDFRIQGPGSNTGELIPSDTRVIGISLHDGVSQFNINDVLISGIHIENMEIACFTLSGAAGGFGCRRIAYRDCYATKSRQDGFNDFGGEYNEDISFHDCYATDLDGFGFEVGNGQGLSIQNCVIRNTGQSAIGIEYSAGGNSSNNQITIANNHITNIGTTGYPAAEGITLGQSANPQNTILTGNALSNIGGHGIVGNGVPNNITISNNMINNVGGGTPSVGVFGFNGTNVHVLNNIVTSEDAGYNMNQGVIVQGESSTNLISGNIVRGAVLESVGSGAGVHIQRVLQDYVNVNAVSNFGSSEADLMLHSIPGYTLTSDSQSMSINAFGTTFANANVKRLRLRFGSSLLFDTSDVVSNNVNWNIQAKITRVSSSVINCTVIGQYNGVTLVPVITILGSQDFTTDNVVKFTGQSPLGGEITQTSMSLEFKDSY